MGNHPNLEVSQLLARVLFPAESQLRIDKVEVTKEKVVIAVSATRLVARCPYCQTESRRVNGSYRRRPADLPFGGHEVQLDLLVRRFFCDNGQCRYRTFAERFPAVLVPYARRTDRLGNQQQNVAFVVGGEAGSRLLGVLGMPASPDTLLRLVRQKPEPELVTPRVLGIDDWARRKGHSYGTILVDLERHQVVDLLPDRTSETVENWLLAHPGIDIVARDRSTEYAHGVTAGAPSALQVADRWHLLLNLRQMLERLLSRLYARLKRLPEVGGTQGAGSATARRGRFPRTQTDTAASQASRARRLARYEEIQRRRRSGQTISQIARKLSLHRATVRLCYYAEQFPERCQRELMPSILDPFLPYLEQRHQEGCENALQLWREMKAMGYPGSRRQVSKWMQKQRAEPAPSTPRKYLKTKPAPSPLASKERSEAGNKERLPSVKQLAWLLVRDSDTLTEQEAATLKRIRQEPVIEKVYALAQRFVSMVRQRVVTMLDSWLDACHDSEIANLQTFAAGIRQDYQAVRAALETAWSNGQTEGQINRLKMLKRQMYGRANFDLLRKRMLGLPVVAPCQRPP